MNSCSDSKFKFYFSELSGIFFPNIFSLQLVECEEAEPMDTEGGLNCTCFLLYWTTEGFLLV